MTATPRPPVHTHAAIIATGDELVSGQNLDTNSRWLAARLRDLGIETAEHITLGDTRDGLAATLRRLAASVPLIIVTGGLGPTQDDLTRDALADATGDTLTQDADALARLEARFAALGRALAPNQRLQALRPSRALCLPNPTGTAPGLFARITSPAGATDVFCLPGPPRELIPMFEADVAPRLSPDPARRAHTRVLHASGIGEGDAAARLADILDRDRNPLVGITASGAVLSLRIRATGPDPAATLALDDTERQIRLALGRYIFGADADTLESVVVSALRARAEGLVLVESCTGGMLGQLLTAVPGASDVLLGGWVSYANAWKIAEVGVPPDTLAQHGAVSEPTARAMAFAGLRRAAAIAAADPQHAWPARPLHALAITGIAGPGGGTPDKPVGTVYIAHAPPGLPAAEVDVRRLHITGDRDDIRTRAARAALTLLLFRLRDTPTAPPPLLWEPR